MATYRTKDQVFFLQEESAYNVEPDVVAAGDAALTRTIQPFKRSKARLDRDKDLDRSASTFSTQGGREKSEFTYENAVIPAGVTATPTAPDYFVLPKTHFGAQTIHAAHSTTTTGSAGTALNLATGGVAAMGLVVGDIIFVNVSAAVGIEARQVRALPGSDVVTMCRALTADPATGRAVYGTVNWKYSQNSLLSFRGYQYLNGDFHRQACGGINPSQFQLSGDWSSETTEIQEKYSGPGAQLAPYATTIPTPSLLATAFPLTTNQGFAWLGSAKVCINKFQLTANNGIVLIENGSCGEFPTGLKRTGNDGKYDVQLSIDYTLDAEAHFDAADALTPIDVIVQLGNQLGSMAAFVCRRWIPDADRGDIAGLFGDMLAGRCYATVGTEGSELVYAHG
jgi:hypothetical protein